MAHVLREARDIADPADLFAAIPTEQPDPDMVQLERQRIDRQTGAFDPSNGEERYETRLHQVIDAKQKGRKVSPR